MSDTKDTVRVRFAPSPTGSLHLGGARTALFNYLFAKKNNGKYILRIEDTDLKRSTKEAIDTIFDSLSWLGIKEDEGPFYQTKRFNLYKEYTKKLLLSGNAYKCYCTQEELEKKREELRNKKEKPKYPGTCRPKEKTKVLEDEKDKRPFVIRLRTKEEGFSVFNDLILGEIKTPYKEIDDFIIVRSDGSPTYNFVVVVDDIDMKMTHIIRGNDHVSNTPKQIAIYEALNVKPPKFAHVPMILGPDKKKLSKRHGATSVSEYENEGFLKDAFINYLARLGWSYGDKEIFTREELESLFSLKNIGKSAAIFDFQKLLWVNEEHIKKLSPEELAPIVIKEIKRRQIEVKKDILEDKNFLKLIESLTKRSKTIVEMADKCLWYFVSSNNLKYNEKSVKKHLKPKIKDALEALIFKLENETTTFKEEELETHFHKVIEDYNLKLAKLAQPVRVSLTGDSVSPPIYTVLNILQKEESIKRLKKGLSLI